MIRCWAFRIFDCSKAGILEVLLANLMVVDSRFPQLAVYMVDIVLDLGRFDFQQPAVDGRVEARLLVVCWE